MHYAKIITEKAINTNPPRRAVINGREVTGQLPAAYLATLDYYPLDEVPEPSTPAAHGKHWEARYALSVGRVTQSWVEADDPAPAPRTFDPYKLQDALMSAGVWSRVKAWLKADDDRWDRWLKAPDIDEDEPLLVDGISSAKEAFGWTDEQVEAVLAQAEIGGAS